MSLQSRSSVSAISPAAWQVQRVLVPLDLSVMSQSTLETALDLAERLEARVDVVHVCAPLPFTPPEALDLSAGERIIPVYERLQRDAEAYLRRLVGEAKDARERVEEILVRAGEPAYEIVRLADEGDYDLIVMGTHGRTGLGRVLLGSVAETVSRLAKQPVLTFHVGARS